MAIVIKRQDGTVDTLDAAAVALGINTSQRIGRQLEVTGFIVSRTTEEPGVAATAVVLAAEGPGICQLAINNDYDPDRPTRNWRRTLTFAGGNVGIGTEFEVGQPPTERLVVQGNILVTGDVRLEGADCAEEFAVDEEHAIEPGTVMVIGGQEQLRQCANPYDTRVAGICSGAGACRPGIILGRQPSLRARVPLALAGKAYCKVDADYSPVEIGDLLTTSATLGHAMKVTDPRRAVGAILGKALGPLSRGRGLVPVLISLQ